MNKWVQYFIVIILGLIILNGITEIQRYTDSISFRNVVDNKMLWSYFYISLLSIMFGILIEWKRVLAILGENLKVNALIIPTIILLVVSLIPFSYTIKLVGISTFRHLPLGFLFAPMQNTHTLIILGVLIGILLVRSLKN